MLQYLFCVLLPQCFNTTVYFDVIGKRTSVKFILGTTLIVFKTCKKEPQRGSTMLAREARRTNSPTAHPN